MAIDSLADAVFGSDASANAQVRLQNHVSRLRKRLGATVVVTHPHGYCLGADCELDCTQFEELAAAAGAMTTAGAVASELWAEALALWRGPPFAEVSEWEAARSVAARLDELLRVAQEEHAAALLSEGRSTDVVGVVEALVSEEPLRERRWALLMLSLYRSGRQADALRAFERARRLLVEEVGVSPGPDLVDLQGRMLAQDPALGTIGALPLPVETSLPSEEVFSPRPSGTVTFLFTDIEGSTRLWRDHPDEMQEALGRHHEILQTVIARWEGYIFSTAGDGFGAAFGSAKGAVAAAMETQAALAFEPWPVPATVRVRMGLHTGEAQERDGNYFGPTLNRAARIMAAGHGGQILASAVVAHLAGDDALVTDLGWHRLRDIGSEQLLQITPPGLDARFPPPRAEPQRRSNLPTPADTFIGRQRELDQLFGAVAAHRLVTILGVGGMGKTRLAVEAAARADEFTDGTWLVELAPVRADDEVADAVASTLGLRPSPGVTATEQLVDWCRRVDALIILDNCEHVIGGVAVLAGAILATGPTATLLATSREPLMVAGEHIFPIGPLALPTETDQQSDALRLIVDRAQAERPDFDAAAHRDALVEISARLDGMPLAIELAAARLRALAPDALVERLNDRFRLLTGGRRTATERHKTFRATVDWSYDLLTARQRRLFERLAVFSGPFGVDDVVAIDQGDAAGDRPAGRENLDVEVVEVLTELVDRSLVTASNSHPPYRMLETLRTYGIEQLHASGIVDQVRRLHAQWFHTKAAIARVEQCGPADYRVYQAMIAQMNDYRAAIAWAADHDDVELLVGIQATLREMFWLRSEILGPWATPTPGQPDGDVPATRARATWLRSSCYQFELGDLDAAEDAVADAVRLDPTNPFCRAQSAVQAWLTGRPDRMLDDANAMADLVGDDPIAKAAGYLLLGSANLLLGHMDSARSIAEEFSAWARLREWPTALGHALHLKAQIDLDEFPDRALAQLDEALRIAQDIDSYGMELTVRRDMTSLLIEERPAATMTTLLDTLRRCRDHHDLGLSSFALGDAVILLARHGNPVAAARLLAGKATPLTGRDRERLAGAVTQLQDRLGSRYDEIVAGGSVESRWELLNIAIAALSECVEPSEDEVASKPIAEQPADDTDSVTVH